MNKRNNTTQISYQLTTETARAMEHLVIASKVGSHVLRNRRPSRPNKPMNGFFLLFFTVNVVRVCMCVYLRKGDFGGCSDVCVRLCMRIVIWKSEGGVHAVPQGGQGPFPVTGAEPSIIFLYTHTHARRTCIHTYVYTGLYIHYNSTRHRVYPV